MHGTTSLVRLGKGIGSSSMPKRGQVMQENEGLGRLGVAALAIMALGLAAAMVFGFSATFWFALVLVPVVFGALILLCRGRSPDEP